MSDIEDSTVLEYVRLLRSGGLLNADELYAKFEDRSQVFWEKAMKKGFKLSKDIRSLVASHLKSMFSSALIKFNELFRLDKEFLSILSRLRRPTYE